MGMSALDVLNSLGEVGLQSRGKALTVSITENAAQASVDFAATGTAAAVGTTAGVSALRYGLFVISGLAAETISVTGLIGAAADIATGVLQVETTAGVKQVGSALANGTYYLRDFAVKNLVFTKSAGANNVTITAYLKA